MSLTRRGRLVVLFLVLVGFLAVPAIGGYLYLRSIGVYGSSDPGEEVVILVPKGADAAEVAEVLEGKGVIPSALGFRVAVYLDGGFDDVKAGRHRLPQGLTARDALSLLTQSTPQSEDEMIVTFPEGSWLIDFAQTLEKKTDISGRAFYKLVAEGGVRSELLPPGGETLEGLLFPATYRIGAKEGARSVARRLAAEMESRAEEAGVLEAGEELGITSYEALIVASLVEAEAKVDEDRAKIARVIYNRLEKSMPLQIDATVYYALGRRGGTLDPSDLATDSPYNTRLVVGLPPTPIGAPGAASLEATMHPEEGEWLYYVLIDCEGHHAFSESYSEFLDNKRVFQGLDCS